MKTMKVQLHILEYIMEGISMIGGRLFTLCTRNVPQSHDLFLMSISVVMSILLFHSEVI
jgi:hypothetical protein